MFLFQKLFSMFWRESPKGNKLYLINDYDTLLIDITKNWEEIVGKNDFTKFKQKLIHSFEALWKMVALYNFKSDLERFYLKTELEEHFKFDISQAEEEFIEAGPELNEMIPFEEPNDALYQEIKAIRKEAIRKSKKQNEEKEIDQDESLRNLK